MDRLIVHVSSGSNGVFKNIEAFEHRFHIEDGTLIVTKKVTNVITESSETSGKMQEIVDEPIHAYAPGKWTNAFYDELPGENNE